MRLSIIVVVLCFVSISACKSRVENARGLDPDAGAASCDNADAVTPDAITGADTTTPDSTNSSTPTYGSQMARLTCKGDCKITVLTITGKTIGTSGNYGETILLQDYEFAMSSIDFMAYAGFTVDVRVAGGKEAAELRALSSEILFRFESDKNPGITDKLVLPGGNFYEGAPYRYTVVGVLDKR